MKRISLIKNIGPKGESWLREIGIHSAEELAAMGSVEAYLRLRASRPGNVNLLALYAMEAGLLGMHWLELPPELKQQLRAQVEAAEAESAGCRRL